MGRRVLVVAPEPLEDAPLAELTGPDVEVLVVVPASHLSFGQWLANEEDAARAEAGEAAARTEDVLAPQAGRVEAAVGDPDPVQAAEDALRTFAADELLVVLPDGGGRDPSWVERTTAAAFERLGVPVRTVARPGP